MNKPTVSDEQMLDNLCSWLDTKAHEDEDMSYHDEAEAVRDLRTIVYLTYPSGKHMIAKGLCQLGYGTFGAERT